MGIRRKVKYFISSAIYFSLKEKFVYWRNIPLAMNQVGKFSASEEELTSIDLVSTSQVIVPVSQSP